MKHLKYLLGIICIGAFFVFTAQVAKGITLYYLPESSTGVASTTASFIIGGTATTTKTITSDGNQQISYLVALASSTTPPTLCWQNEYSNNGTDWYNEDSVYASSSPTHIVGENQQCVTYATTTASNLLSRGRDNVTLYIGRRIDVPNLSTTYTRTKFSIGATQRAMLDVRSTLKNEVITTK